MVGVAFCPQTIDAFCAIAQLFMLTQYYTMVVWDLRVETETLLRQIRFAAANVFLNHCGERYSWRPSAI